MVDDEQLIWESRRWIGVASMGDDFQVAIGTDMVHESVGARHILAVAFP
jgi:hypothetical protein